MKSTPVGGIFDNKNGTQKIHANLVLECLSILNTTKDIFIKKSNPYISQMVLNKEFTNILNTLYNSQTDACSYNLISVYYNWANTMNEQKALYEHPYTFLYYFLRFLDEEYNKALNIKINFQNNSSQNIDQVINNLKSIYESQQFSLIAKDYFFTIIEDKKCNSCGTAKYEWNLKRLIDLNIDEYKYRKNGGPLSLNECLQFYISGRNVPCNNCRQNNSVESRFLYNTGRVLIINLITRNITGQTDPYLNIETNINISLLKKDPNLFPQNNNYILKARILYAGPQYGYFADCFIKKENMNGTWYRYINENKREINPNDLKQYQNILLFYEINDNPQLNNNMN